MKNTVIAMKIFKDRIGLQIRDYWRVFALNVLERT